MENKKLITVEASMENLDKITSFVEAFLDDYACPMKIAMKILLCVEELYANVVNYAYGSRGGNCTIELEGKHMKQNMKSASVCGIRVCRLIRLRRKTQTSRYLRMKEKSADLVFTW